MKSEEDFVFMFAIVHFNVSARFFYVIWLAFWISLSLLEYTMKYETTTKKVWLLSVHFFQFKKTEYINATSVVSFYIELLQLLCIKYVLLHYKGNLYITKGDSQEKYSALSIQNL